MANGNEEQREFQEMPDGMTVCRVDDFYRYYEVLDADKVVQNFQLITGEKTARLTSVTTYLNFPDKGALVPWAAGLAAEEAARIARREFPGILSHGMLDRAKPHTMLYVSVRDWFLAGFSDAEITQKAFEINMSAFAKPLSGDEMESLISAARSAAEHTLEDFEAGITQMEASAAYAHKIERDEAADLGTRIHKWVELDLKGVQQDLPEDLVPAVNAYKKWRSRKDFQAIVSLEQIIYYAVYPVIFAGTVDAIFRLADGTLGIVDFKTSNGIYESHIVQIAAYAKAWEWLTGEKVTRGWAVRFGKEDGVLEEQEVDIELYWPTFEALVPARDLYKVAIDNSKAAAGHRKKEREAKEREARKRRAQETAASQPPRSSNGANSGQAQNGAARTAGLPTNLDNVGRLMEWTRDTFGVSAPRDVVVIARDCGIEELAGITKVGELQPYLHDKRLLAAIANSRKPARAP